MSEESDKPRRASREPIAPVEPPEPPRKPRDGGQWSRLVAGVFVLLMLFVIAYVVKKQDERPADSGGPFDPTTTDTAELRRVTEAVSRVIAAPEGRAHTNAVEVLESLAVQSAGARDLKDACVSTYRGLLLAAEKLEAVRAILVQSDGGMRPQSEISAPEAARASTLLREADEQRERVTATRNRCQDLYAIAVRRFGLAAERPRGN
ncbi:MAG: hypothetical protein JNK05_18240 [Myxococcales bacterium]|nr:hypothetical protein [Myxococcales bacterium]